MKSSHFFFFALRQVHLRCGHVSTVESTTSLIIVSASSFFKKNILKPTNCATLESHDMSKALVKSSINDYSVPCAYLVVAFSLPLTYKPETQLYSDVRRPKKGCVMRAIYNDQPTWCDHYNAAVKI